MFSGKTDKSDLTNNSPNILMTEKEKYANFEAEFSCKLLGITDGAEMLKILGSFENFTIEHGYTAEMVQANVEKYSKDEEFRQIAFNDMRTLCPTKIDAAGLTSFTSAV